MKKSRVYIAGRVGDVSDPNVLRIRQANFERCEKALARLGYKAVNPMKIVPQGTEWKDAMRICLKALCDCDYISLLPVQIQQASAKLNNKIKEHLFRS